MCLYRTCWHRLTGVYLGFPLPHDPRSIMPIKWRALCLNLNLPDDGPAPCPHATRVLDNYARSTGWLMDYFHRTASLPDGLHDMLRQPGTPAAPAAAPDTSHAARPYGMSDARAAPCPIRTHQASTLAA